MTHTYRVGVACVWEHNGNDTMLYAVDCPGAFTRGISLQEAVDNVDATPTEALVNEYYDSLLALNLIEEEIAGTTARPCLIKRINSRFG